MKVRPLPRRLGKTWSRVRNARLAPPSRRYVPPVVVWRSLFRRQIDRKVDFVIAGVMRGGTSALFDYIAQHPEICVPARKEVRFFDRNGFFSGPPDYAKYHAWFDPQPQHRAMGEASPSYIYAESHLRRIYEYNPAMRVIAILRNPIDRAYSHWNMERMQGWEKESFSDFLARYRASPDGRVSKRGFIERGRYSRQVKDIWRIFGREQTLLLRNEELSQNKNETLNRFFSFVGVSEYTCAPIPRPPHVEYPAPMSDADRDYLKELYRPEIKALETLLDWDLGEWLA